MRLEKGSVALWSSHEIEGEENVVTLEEMKCDGKGCVRSDRMKKTSWPGEKPVIHVNNVGETVWTHGDKDVRESFDLSWSDFAPAWALSLEIAA